MFKLNLQMHFIYFKIECMYIYNFKKYIIIINYIKQTKNDGLAEKKIVKGKLCKFKTNIHFYKYTKIK